MDLSLEEQKLLADFRKLGPEGRKELLGHAAYLGRKLDSTPDESAPAANQCRLEPTREKRPESTKEPIFTE